MVISRMKLVLRVIGTWMIALALILVVVDGTKSLAASGPVITSFGALWAGLDAPSWLSTQESLSFYLSPYGVHWLADALFSVPGWALAGAVGVIALFLGRKRRPTVYADTI